MSIKRIAEKVGVSTSTVSRILRNPDYKCSIPGLRSKIWQAAMELNYTPNEAARNLKRGHENSKERKYCFQILMTQKTEEKSDSFEMELLRIVESELYKNACTLSEIWYEPAFWDFNKYKKEKTEQILEEMAVKAEKPCDGLIIIGRCDKVVLEKLKDCYKNVVAINGNTSVCEVDEVACDGEKIATIAVEHLIQLGHREIGYVGECYNEARYRGYVKTMQKYGMDIKPSYIKESKQTEADGFHTMRQFLKDNKCPTGIYCADDIIAVGMLKCLNRYKNRNSIMPSIISSDGIEAAQYTRPMLTTVSLPKEEMGRFAVYLLLDRIRGGHKSAVFTEVEGKLMLRNSCSAIEENMWSDYVI